MNRLSIGGNLLKILELAFVLFISQVTCSLFLSAFSKPSKFAQKGNKDCLKEQMQFLDSHLNKVAVKAEG